MKRGDSQTHVWVRAEVVDVLLQNDNQFPRGWKLSRKRGRESEHWGWIRARAVPTTPTDNAPSNSPYGHVKLRKTGQNNRSSGWDTGRQRSNQSSPLQLTIDDEEFAPDYFQGQSVSLQPPKHSDEDDNFLVMANSWWRLGEMPPDDLTGLTHLHEPAVVYCLQKRYEMDEIYTYTGKILLALNPFRACRDLYGESVMRRYWGEVKGRLKPHVYSTAQDAYSIMMGAMRTGRGNENQSILVSGESGAGKTVTTKIIMSYLTTLSRKHLFTKHNTANDNSEIESQVLQSNPILESFGNARTLRNDNSSRFGKFIEIKFHSSGCLAAASIETYLLEKVRLITQAPGERNYHVFYELLAGLPQRERREYHIGNATVHDFKMTAWSGTFDRRDGVDDRDTFRDLREALQTVGFSRLDQNNMFTVCCALLFASNLTFRETQEEASELDQANPSLRHALSLLGVSAQDLNSALCFSVIEARGETLFKNLSVAQASKALEALLKVTYSALFAHIVKRVNQSIKVQRQSSRQQNEDRTAYIGVLDIFGFESFEENSFEQLCINFCNEALQQQFNRFVFKLEQQDYKREGIDWSFITFPDNQDVLDLIEKKHVGILSILDEQCFLRTCTDQTFARVLYEKCADNPRFRATNTQKMNGTFSVQHYAGSVEYQTATFLEKNKDELPKETRDLLMSSSNQFIAYLGNQLNETSTKQKKPSGAAPQRKVLRKTSSSLVKESVGSQFSSQLGELRERINRTTPHYVRCLKPNDDLVPDNFHHLVIADQLRCAGVLEAIRVSRVGFPQRYAHDAFVQRYRMLFLNEMNSLVRLRRGGDQCEFLVAEATKMVCEHIGEGAFSSREVQAGIQMGRTKVFLRSFAFEALERLRSVKMDFAATAIQKAARGFLGRLNFLIALEAALILQSFARRIHAIRRAVQARRRRAATRIQACWRGFVADRYFLSALFIAQWCQSTYRGMVARELCAFMLIENKAKAIQGAWRRHKAISFLHSARVIAWFGQSYLKVLRAKIELQQLKQEARDLQAVAKERDKFKQEALRLRRILENNKSERSSSVYERGLPVRESVEVDELKDEVKRLKAQLNRSMSEEVNSLVAESAAKDAELEVLRQEVARLRSPESTPGRQPLSLLTTPLRRNETDLMSENNQLAQNRSTILSPFTNFVTQKGKGEDIDGNTPSSSPSIGGAQSVSSSSLLDSSVAEDDYGTMNVSPAAAGRIARSMRPAIRSEASFFHHAVRHGNEARVRQILEESEIVDLMVNECDQSGRSPLHMAVSVSSLAIVGLLLQHDAVANAQDQDGNTPLHLSTKPPIVLLLLSNGRANPNIPNHHGLCALHFAVQRQDATSVQHLIRHGADVNSADNIKWYSALHIVAHPEYGSGHVGLPGSQGSSKRLRSRIAGMLCGATRPSEADPNSRDSEGNTPLHLAVTLETKEACDVLSIFLGRGASPNFVNNRGQTPLHLLCHNESLRHLKVMQEMLHDMLFHGANPNMTSKTGCTALHLALYHRDIDSAVQLMNSGAELHLLWTKPQRWVTFWEDTGTAEILALDMVEDEHDLHRLLAAISKPQKWAPSRSRCMQCKATLGTFARAIHCRHCGRMVCGACSHRSLAAHFFPKSFELNDSAWVCLVCEKILVSRREDEFSDTQPATSYLEDDEDRMY